MQASQGQGLPNGPPIAASYTGGMSAAASVTSPVDTVTIALGERSYPIRIGAGLVGDPAAFDSRASCMERLPFFLRCGYLA